MYRVYYFNFITLIIMKYNRYAAIMPVKLFSRVFLLTSKQKNIIAVCVGISLKSVFIIVKYELHNFFKRVGVFYVFAHHRYTIIKIF